MTSQESGKAHAELLESETDTVVLNLAEQICNALSQVIFKDGSAATLEVEGRLGTVRFDGPNRLKLPSDVEVLLRDELRTQIGTSYRFEAGVNKRDFERLDQAMTEVFDSSFATTSSSGHPIPAHHKLPCVTKNIQTRDTFHETNYKVKRPQPPRERKQKAAAAAAQAETKAEEGEEDSLAKSRALADNEPSQGSVRCSKEIPQGTEEKIVKDNFCTLNVWTGLHEYETENRDQMAERKDVTLDPKEEVRKYDFRIVVNCECEVAATCTRENQTEMRRRRRKSIITQDLEVDLTRVVEEDAQSKSLGGGQEATGMGGMKGADPREAFEFEVEMNPQKLKELVEKRDKGHPKDLFDYCSDFVYFLRRCAEFLNKSWTQDFRGRAPVSAPSSSAEAGASQQQQKISNGSEHANGDVVANGGRRKRGAEEVKGGEQGGGAVSGGVREAQRLNVLANLETATVAPEAGKSRGY